MLKKVICIMVWMVMISSYVFGQFLVKEPSASGRFYSSNPLKLKVQIQKYFDAAKIEPFQKKVYAIIVPHAGYMYSGAVAAYSYKAVSRQSVKTVVLLGPSHFYPLDGVSIWKEGYFKTPLGNIEVDNEFASKLIASNQRFRFIPQAFEKEHSLEVQMPFLQETFDDIKIIPVLMGMSRYKDCEDLAVALDEVIGERNDVLIVVSTDLSHYHNSKTAEMMDRGTLSKVEKLDAQDLWQGCLLSKGEMCGASAVITALLYARRRGLEPRILKYAHSGDVTGDNSSVVGYSSAVFLKSQEEGPTQGLNENKREEGEGAMLTREQKKKLLKIARETIKVYLKTGEVISIKEDDRRLWKQEGAFVTLHKKGQLRGCIGHIIGQGPLFLTIRDVAIASATQDPRFSRVGENELDDIDIEISVLSKPERTTDVGEIQMGVHGVIVSQGLFHRGVFLPQVATETGWSREEFLNALCEQKAGLPSDAWKDPKTTIEIFTADVFSEKELFKK